MQTGIVEAITQNSDREGKTVYLLKVNGAEFELGRLRGR